ncbi:MAG: MAPEG family protein [Pseudomonadota bacterium]|jgi:uncharacterized MAPEG superfamily protein
MTPELLVLTLAALLQALQHVLMSVAVNLDIGPARTLAPRDHDDLRRDLSLTSGRLLRAFENHFEALALFTIATLVITLSGQSTAFTAAMAWTYLAARILYVPAYAFGWVPWRSVIWSVGWAATLAMLVASLF